MNWTLSHRADPAAALLADAHYSRQKPGSPQFVPPGRCVVLLSRDRSALWVSSWPFAEYCHHQWAGAWICSLFRNTGPVLSSLLIREAASVTRRLWGPPPALGMITFVNSGRVRHKRDPGRCFLRAGFRRCGETKGGLLAFQLLPAGMPEPEAAWSPQGELFGREVAA